MSGRTDGNERPTRQTDAKTNEIGLTIAVIIPVYGEHHLTRAVLDDLNRDRSPCNIFIVDNGGDYQETGGEQVLRPASNLHWAGGCNLGLLAAQEQGYSAHVLLNNDVRLSPGFLHGLVDAWQHNSPGLVGPVYDHNWPQQRIAYRGRASAYRPREHDHVVPFVDGTCMLIPNQTLQRVGPLDETTWPRYGWGCDKDYALRVRQAGGTVWVTERAYLNHFARGTAARASWYSEHEAEVENDAGMTSKWGPDWRDMLYANFVDTPRDGLVQQRIRRDIRRSDVSEQMRDEEDGPHALQPS